eukprot:948552-Rhodomonas_salina.2
MRQTLGRHTLQHDAKSQAARQRFRARPCGCGAEPLRPSPRRSPPTSPPARARSPGPTGSRRTAATVRARKSHSASKRRVSSREEPPPPLRAAPGRLRAPLRSPRTPPHPPPPASPCPAPLAASAPHHRRQSARSGVTAGMKGAAVSTNGSAAAETGALSA